MHVRHTEITSCMHLKLGGLIGGLSFLISKLQWHVEATKHVCKTCACKPSRQEC